MDKDSISLNKYISSKGLCSRREADSWIEQGRLKLNGKIAVKGNRVGPKDEVLLDGQLITFEDSKVYLLLNKPPGVTCTTDLKDSDNIIDYINYKSRIFPIGRLDKASSGLIIMTNDGDIVNRVLRKENKHEKEYIVKVNRSITSTFLKNMSAPVSILGTKTLPTKVERISKTVFRIILTQGLNRQIRRMCESFDYKVVSLKRIRIMHLELDNLRLGEWRYLTKTELKLLFKKLDHQK